MAQIAFWLFVAAVPVAGMLHGPGAGTLARLVGMIAMPCGVLGVISAGRIRTHPILFWMALFIVSAVLSSLWAVKWQGSLNIIMTYGQLLVMVWLALQLLVRTADVRVAMMAYVLGSYVTAIGTLQTFATSTGDNLRWAAAGLDPNNVGSILAIGVAIAWYLTLTGRSWLRLIPLLYLPIGVFAILVTASRTAALAAALACMMPLILVRRVNDLLYVSIPAIAAVVIALHYVPESSFERISTGWEEMVRGTMSGRTLIWWSGLEVLKHSPILGVGTGQFGPAVASVTDGIIEKSAHNVFLTAAVEQGLVGLMLFGAVVVVAVRPIRTMPRREQRFWIALLLVVLSAAMTLSWLYTKPIWLMLAMVAAHGAALRDEQREQVWD